MVDHQPKRISLKEFDFQLRDQEDTIGELVYRLRTQLANYNAQDALALLVDIQKDPKLAGDIDLQEYVSALHLHMRYMQQGHNDHPMPTLPDSLADMELPVENFRLNADPLVFTLTALIKIIAEQGNLSTDDIIANLNSGKLVKVEAKPTIAAPAPKKVEPHIESNALNELLEIDQDIAEMLLSEGYYDKQGQPLVRRTYVLQLIDATAIQMATSKFKTLFPDVVIYRHADLREEMQATTDRRFTFHTLSDVVMIVRTLKKQKSIRKNYKMPLPDASKK